MTNCKDAYQLGWDEAVGIENGKVFVSSFGRTHEADQDWNEAYDQGRADRIKVEGIEEEES